jgi:BirA family transcriptional regulator, biotin operon repressor / biotin---[acetyl-CoA-carboxylase] ligase
LLTVAKLERALSAAGLWAPVRWDEVTGSTNTTALAMAEEGAPEWTLVAAGHQTAGRGRLGRTWLDRPGEAIMFSFVLRPRLDPEKAGLLPLLAGAAMAEAALGATAREIRCKWPNDLVVDDRKAGGILAESSFAAGTIRHVVIGIGVNLEPPADVSDAAGLGDADPEALLSGFLRSFRARYHPSSPGFPAEVRSAWRAVAATLGEAVEVDRLDGPPVGGTAIDVDDRGALVVQTATGIVAVTSGEVAHLDEPSS